MMDKNPFERREENGFALINDVFFLIMLTSPKPHLICLSEAVERIRYDYLQRYLCNNCL